MTPFSGTLEFLLEKAVIVIPIGILLAIAFGLYAHSTQDAAAKRQAQAWAWWCLSPIAAFIFLLIVYGTNIVVSNSLG